MKFQRYTTVNKSNSLIKIIVKVVLVFLLFFVAIILFDKIDFPAPNKSIEKIISNENLKIVK